MPRKTSNAKTDEWISPNEAVDLVSHYAGNAYLAKQLIADGLRSQKLDACVDVMWEERDNILGEVWTPKNIPPRVYEEDIELERSIWRCSEGWPDDFAHWRWDTAEFVLFTSPRDGPPIMIFMQGVMLRQSDLLALVGRSSRAGVGGPKPDRVRWAKFWANVLYETTGKTFDWTQFDSPHHLKEKLHEWSGGEFSDNNIDIAVDTVWRCVVLRCADDERAGPGARVSAE